MQLSVNYYSLTDVCICMCGTGSNVIKLQDVAFGFPSPSSSTAATGAKDKPATAGAGGVAGVNMLFEHVDLCMDQNSRIALVGKVCACI